jgi:hypothetical protein
MVKIRHLLGRANSFLKRTRLISKGVHALGYGISRAHRSYVRSAKKGYGINRTHRGYIRSAKKGYGRRCGGMLSPAGGMLHPAGTRMGPMRMRNLPMAY